MCVRKREEKKKEKRKRDDAWAEITLSAEAALPVEQYFLHLYRIKNAIFLIESHTTLDIYLNFQLFS